MTRLGIVAAAAPNESGPADLKARFNELARKAAERPKPQPTIGERCGTCGGSGWRVVDEAASKCADCRPSVDELLRRAGVPELELDSRIDAGVHEQNAENAALLSDLVDARFEVEGDVRSLYFHGGYGVGKSWLAAGVLRAALERLGWSVGWVTTRDLLVELRSLNQRNRRAVRDGGEEDAETEASITRRFRLPKLLVVNELPREKQSLWVAEQVEGLIDHRSSAKKVTILTANVEIDEIQELYNGALASRLARYLRVPFVGEDLRRNGQ